MTTDMQAKIGAFVYIIIGLACISLSASFFCKSQFLSFPLPKNTQLWDRGKIHTTLAHGIGLMSEQRWPSFSVAIIIYRSQRSSPRPFCRPHSDACNISPRHGLLLLWLLHLLRLWRHKPWLVSGRHHNLRRLLSRPESYTLSFSRRTYSHCACVFSHSLPRLRLCLGLRLCCTGICHHFCCSLQVESLKVWYGPQGLSGGFYSTSHDHYLSLGYSGEHIFDRGFPSPCPSISVQGTDEDTCAKRDALPYEFPSVQKNLQVSYEICGGNTGRPCECDSQESSRLHQYLRWHRCKLHHSTRFQRPWAIMDVFLLLHSWRYVCCRSSDCFSFLFLRVIHHQILLQPQPETQYNPNWFSTVIWAVLIIHYLTTAPEGRQNRGAPFLNQMNNCYGRALILTTRNEEARATVVDLQPSLSIIRPGGTVVDERNEIICSASRRGDSDPMTGNRGAVRLSEAISGGHRHRHSDGYCRTSGETVPESPERLQHVLFPEIRCDQSS